MKLKVLAASLPGKVRLIGDGEVQISSIFDDSRKVKPGALFACTPGLKVDGHNFAPQAVEKGAVALMVERELALPVPQVVVEDVRTALSYAAAAFYGHPAMRVRLIGITGGQNHHEFPA